MAKVLRCNNKTSIRLVLFYVLLLVYYYYNYSTELYLYNNLTRLVYIFYVLFYFLFFFKYLYTLYYEIALIFQISALWVDLNKIALVGYLLDKMNDSIQPFVSRTDIVNLHYTAVCHGVTCSPTTHTHTHKETRVETPSSSSSSVSACLDTTHAGATTTTHSSRVPIGNKHSRRRDAWT